MLRPLALGLALGSLLAAPAARADLSYSYVDGTLFIDNTNTALGEQDGQGVEGWFSYGVLPLLLVFGGARQIEFDDLPVDVTFAEAGVGVNYDFNALQSFYFDVAAVSSQADSVTAGGPKIGTDDDGYTYRVGYREMNKTGKIEFNVAAEHIEFDKADDAADTWLDVGLLFRATKRLKVQTTVQFAGDENAFKVGVRYYLPNRLDERE